MTMDLLMANLSWPWVFAVALAFAAGSGSFLLLQQGADLAWRLSKGRARIAGRRVGNRLSLASAPMRLTHYVPMAFAILAAAVVAPRGPFVAACFVVFGLVLNRYAERKRSRKELAEVSQELEKLVTVLHSAYLVRPVVAPALEEAARSVQGPLREAVDRVLRAVWVGSDPKDAYASLGKAIDNPYVAQLGLILERAEECSPVLVGEALKELGGRLQRRRRLQARAKASMSLLSGTVRFLQGANAIAAAVVLATPTLSDFYLASLSRQGLFALALTAVLGTSLYFDGQLSSLKERVL